MLTLVSKRAYEYTALASTGIDIGMFFSAVEFGQTD